MQAELIADSGGTGTDWCYIDAEGKKHFFSGPSLHPMYVDELPTEQDYLFWSEKEYMKAAGLNFFGAGCLNPQNAYKLHSYFTALGFPSVKVRSDLHAAAFAGLKNGSGPVAILGTGSVAAEFNAFELVKVVGGLGYLLGDEGSGFYFGKLVIKELLEGRLSPALTGELYEKLGDRTAILREVYGYNGRAFLASISKETSELEGEELLILHDQNIELFINGIKGHFQLDRQPLTWCGSYAWYNRKLIQKLMSNKDYRCGQFIQRPIEGLSEYFAKDTL